MEFAENCFEKIFQTRIQILILATDKIISVFVHFVTKTHYGPYKNKLQILIRIKLCNTITVFKTLAKSFDT